MQSSTGPWDDYVKTGSQGRLAMLVGCYWPQQMWQCSACRSESVADGATALLQQWQRPPGLVAAPTAEQAAGNTADEGSERPAAQPAATEAMEEDAPDGANITPARLSRSQVRLTSGCVDIHSSPYEGASVGGMLEDPADILYSASGTDYISRAVKDLDTVLCSTKFCPKPVIWCLLLMDVVVNGHHHRRMLQGA
jgi:hypothetical protein